MMKQRTNQRICRTMVLTTLSITLSSLTGCVTGQSGTSSSSIQQSAIQNVAIPTNELACLNAQFLTVPHTCEDGLICNGNDTYLHVTNKCGRTVTSNNDAYFLFRAVDSHNTPLTLQTKYSDIDQFPMDKINTLYHPYFSLVDGESQNFLVQSSKGTPISLDTRYAEGSLMVIDAQKRPNFYQCFSSSAQDIVTNASQNTIGWSYKLIKPKSSFGDLCNEWLTDYRAVFTVSDQSISDGGFLMNSSCTLKQSDRSSISSGCSHIAYSTMRSTIVPLGNLNKWIESPHQSFTTEVQSLNGSTTTYYFNQYGENFQKDGSRYSLQAAYRSNSIPADMYGCLSLKIDAPVGFLDAKHSRLKLVNSCNYPINIHDYAIGFRGYTTQKDETIITPLVGSTLELVDNEDSKLMLTYDDKYQAQLKCVGDCVIKANDAFLTNSAAIFADQASYTVSTQPAISGITRISSISQQYGALSMTGESGISTALTNVEIGKSATITYKVSNNSQNDMVEKIVLKALPDGFSYDTNLGFDSNCNGALLSGGSSCTIKVRYKPTTHAQGKLQFNVPDALVKSGLSTTLSIPYGTYAEAPEFEIMQVNPASHTMNNKLTSIPVGSSGMASYQIINNGGSDTNTISLPKLQAPFSYYMNWSDVSYCDGRILKPGEGCFILIRYAPTEMDSGNLNYEWPNMLAGVAKEKGFDAIPYSTR